MTASERLTATAPTLLAIWVVAIAFVLFICTDSIAGQPDYSRLRTWLLCSSDGTSTRQSSGEVRGSHYTKIFVTDSVEAQLFEYDEEQRAFTEYNGKSEAVYDNVRIRSTISIYRSSGELFLSRNHEINRATLEYSSSYSSLGSGNEIEYQGNHKGTCKQIAARPLGKSPANKI